MYLDQSCYDLLFLFAELLGKELDVKNIVNVLHEAKFADGDWAQIGLQLIEHFDSTAIRADHDRAGFCMISGVAIPGHTWACAHVKFAGARVKIM